MDDVTPPPGAHPGLQGELVAAMSDPAFYPQSPSGVEVRETHGSYVFIAGELAYKLKKAVRFEFLDYSTAALRQRMCQEELRLNRRLAPSVYRAVRSLIRTGGGFALAAEDDHPDAIDYVVEMRRFDERLTLAARLAESGAGGDEIDRVAACIAEFHANAEPLPSARDPRPALRTASDETFSSLRELVPSSVEPTVAAARRFTDAFLLRHGATLLQRAEKGLVRDGHGDLRAEHVLLEDPIAIVDCIEFDPALRQADVAADLAFLVMDLERLEAGPLALELVRSYRGHGGDAGDDGLIAFYAAQRAWVRAKVGLLRAGQLESGGHDARGARGETAELLELGRRLSWRARQPLLLVVCGLSASGKSELAHALARASGIGVLSSDVVRKRLAELEPAAPASPDHYTPAFNARTYAELGRLAAAELGRSGTVIVDATFRRLEERELFRRAAGRAAQCACFVECRVPEALRLRRAEQRSTAVSVSDATRAVAEAQIFEPLAEVPTRRQLALCTDQPPEACVAAIERWLDASPDEASD